MGSTFKGVGLAFLKLISGGVTPRGVIIKFEKGGKNIRSWLILEIIKRSRSGSFCFNRNQEAGVGELFKSVIIEGVLEVIELSQQELMEESNSGTKNHRGVRKKNDKIKGNGRSAGFKESTLKVNINI